MKRVAPWLLLACAVNAGAGVNSWTRTGPEGGPAYAVAFHPDSGVVFAMSGPSLYRSEDATASWAAVQGGVGQGRARILVNPTNPLLVMASGINSMQRSDDGGKTFGAMLGPGASPSYTFALAAPPDGSAVYVGSASNDSKVYKTTNFGATWQDVSTGLAPGHYVLDLVADPSDVNTLYVLVDGAGLYKTINAGQQWNLVNSLTGFDARKLAIDPGATSQMLLATVSMGLQTSTNGGVNWAIDAAASAVAPQWAWVGYTPSLPSARNGAAVAVPYSGRVIRRSARTQSWVTGADGKFLIVDDVAFDPHNTDPVNSTLLVATREGPMLSQDGGATFTARSHGIRSGTALGLATARDVGGTMYAAFMDGPIGVHRRSANGWSAANNNNAQLRSLSPSAFQPSALAVNPSDATGLDVIVTTGGMLMRSYDGGLSWGGPSPGVGFGILRSVQFAPSASPTTQNIYAASDPDGVYVSGNGGVTWIKRANGLPLFNGGPQSIGMGAVAVDPATAGTAYASVNTPGLDPAVYKTTDFGVSWVPRSTGFGSVWIQSLVVDPSNSQIVYAGASGAGEGVFKSTNGGSSWARVGAPTGDDPGTSIAIDPVVPTTMIATFTANGTVSRSVDAGATWEPIGSLPAGAVIMTNAVLDPLKSSNIVGAVSSYGLLELEVAPDLGVSFAPPPPATIALGGGGAATVRVVNQGPFAASAVVVNVTLPTGITAPAAPTPTPTQGSCTSTAGGFRCALGAIHVSQQVQIPLTLNAGTTPGQSALTASVTAHEADPASSNDSVSASVTIRRVADLGVALAVSANAVDHHAPLTLTATASNAGPNASSATQVAIELGTAFGYQNATPSNGSCSKTGTTVTCQIGVIDAAASATIAVDVTAEAVGALSPTAAISDGSLQDPAVGNNSSSASVTSRSISDLAVQITDAADPVVAGQGVSYMATVTNNGPDDATSAAVTITIAGATISSATSAQATCVPSGNTANCTLTSLANGATATVNIAATASAAGTATADASVSFTGTDKTSSNNAATQSTTVNAPPSSGGGGGGAFGGLELLALLALVVGRAKSRRIRPQD